MKITVRVHNGMSRCHALEVVESDLIYNVKAKLKAKVLFIDDAIIEYDNKPLADSCALKELHIQEGGQFEARYPNLIFVRSLTGKTMRFLIDDHFSDTIIYSLKEKIADEIGFSPDVQLLVYGGKQPKDDCTFADCHIQHGSILYVSVRLLGSLRQIFVRTLTGKKLSFLIDGHFSDTTIYSLKEKIAGEIGVASSQMSSA
uniref:Ubiquitin-like domain-containing protein n=2 Tax=Triticinae TaxID=1648030 RepID=A0A452ZSF0_AEGTS